MTHGIKWICGSALALSMLLSPALEASTGQQHYRFAKDPVGIDLSPVDGAADADTSADGLSYLLVSDQTILTGPEPVWYRQLVYRVDHERGLAGAGQFSVHFQPAYQRVEIHAVDVWRDNVRIDRREESRVETLRRESGLESGLLDGSLTLSVTIPDIRLGDRIAYRYSVIGSNPIFGEDFHDTFTARYSTPLALREVRYVYPVTMKLLWKTDIDGFTTEHYSRNGVQALHVSARSMKALIEEEGTPSGFDPYGRIEVSTARSWLDVVEWGLPLYPRRLHDRSLAAPLVKRLRLDPADPIGSALRATSFVQGEVRYTGLDMGQNSHAPNLPELVLKRRFGDCKDKTTLLIALLAEAGIKADPVLVHTEHGRHVRERLPSPLAFNHVIVRARIAGSEVWIDPTLDRERGSFENRQPVAYRVGLPIAVESRGLVEIPNPAPDQPLVSVRQNIDFGVDADQMSAAFEVTTEYRQGFADSVRQGFESRGADDIGKGYLDYMQGYYEGMLAHVKPIMSDGKAEGELVVEEQYRTSWSAEDDGTEFGIVLFQVLDWLPKISERERLTPLALGGPRLGSHTIASAHADGWSIGKQDDLVENAYFRFERNVEVSDGLLVVRGIWTRTADEVPATDIDLVREDLAKVRDLAFYNVDLAPSAALFAASWQDWAWPIGCLGLSASLLGLLWLLRRRLAFAGMLYQPRLTIRRLIDGDSLSRGGLALLLLAIMADTAVEIGPKLGGQSTALLWGMVLGGTLAMSVRWLAWSALVRVSFRMLGSRLDYSDLLKTAGWATAPLVLLVTLALSMLKFDLSLLDEESASVEDTPAVLLAAALMILGAGWGLVSAVGAYAALAGVSRRRSLAGVGIAVGIAVAVLLPLVLLAAAAR